MDCIFICFIVSLSFPSKTLISHNCNRLAYFCCVLNSMFEIFMNFWEQIRWSNEFVQINTIGRKYHHCIEWIREISRVDTNVLWRRNHTVEWVWVNANQLLPFFNYDVRRNWSRTKIENESNEKTKIKFKTPMSLNL